MKAEIFHVLTGRVQPFRGTIETSAIGKQPVEGRIKVNRLGLEGDEQADLVNHGGAEKAVHHYPLEHYHYWRERLGPLELLSGAGAFGENISTIGMIEDAVCIGDRFRMGTTLLEVSQGRQPCWKLDHRFGMKGVTAAVVSNGLAGWYYRVLEPGTIEAGDVVELVDRTHPTWTVARVFGLIISGHGKTDQESLRALHGVKALAENWKRRVENMIFTP